MGYYTTFAVTATQDGKEIDFSEEMRKALLEICEELDGGNIDELIEGWFNAKWYSYAQDFAKLSERFPGVLFTVEGHGEDSEDFWKHYFLDGKSQYDKAEIVYAGFDPEKLEQPTPEL